MSSKKVFLKDLISIKHGYAFAGKNIVPDEQERILVTPGHFKIGGGFRHNHKKFFNSNAYKEGYELHQGDLIVTMTDLSKEGDTLGYGAIVPIVPEKILLHNQRIGKVIFNSPDIDIEYCHYLLRSKKYRNHVMATCSGTTVKHTSPQKILDFEFDLPSLSDQKSIAYILSTLEKKIEINLQANQQLEDLARHIFKSWFVNFDLIGMGNANKKIIESEIGKIPSGWSIGNLNDIAVKVGDRFKKDESWDSHKLIDLGRMPTGSISLNEYGQGSELSTSVCKFKKYDFLFGSIRPYLRKAGVAPFDGVTNSSVFTIRSKNQMDRSFLYCYASSENIFLKSIQYSKGTKMPIIGWEDFSSFRFPLPPENLRHQFNDRVFCFFEKIILNTNENEILEKMRDLLLPRLISGELEISDAEKLLKDAGV